MSELPADAHIVNVLSKASEQFADSDSVYYMDMWPFSPPLMVLSSPDTALQAIQQHALRKPPSLTELFRPVTGGADLIFMNGEQWKKGRSVFNPGFNPKYLISQVPAIVEEVVTFQSILRNACQEAQVFQLDPVTLNLTLDVIARITLYVPGPLNLACIDAPPEISSYTIRKHAISSVPLSRVRCHGCHLATSSTYLKGGTRHVHSCSGITPIS